MKRLGIALFFALFIMGASIAFGQKSFGNYPFENAKMYNIELKDGSQIMGTFLSKDSTTIVIKTSALPKVEIPMDKIQTIKEINLTNFKNGKYWFPNPNATRYLFSPSAFNLRRGEGYYQNTMLTLNSFNVGLTDNISIGGGFELISTIISLTASNSTGSTFAPIFFLTPKVGFRVNEKFNAGGGFYM